MKSLKPLLPYLARHRGAVLWGVVFVFLANALYPLVPTTIGSAVNNAEKGLLAADELLLFAGLALVLAALSACFRFLMRRVLIDASRDVEFEIRNDLFTKLQSLDPSYFDKQNTGDLMSRATNDMDLLRMLIGPAVMYTANSIFSLPLTIAWMLVLDWRLTLLSLVPMLGLPPLVKFFSSRTHKASHEQQESFGRMTTMVQENFAGIRVVKAYGQEDAEEKKFLTRNDEYIDLSIQLAKLQAMFFPSIRLLIGFGYLSILIYGGYRIIEGHLQVGTLLAFFLLFDNIIWPLIAAGWTVNLIQRGIAALERIDKVMKAEPRVIKAEAAPGVEFPSAAAIEIKGLTFSYQSDDLQRLKGLDLSVPAGSTIGIVGPVGAGKSTLVQLLARFYPVERGMIALGGRDINDWPVEELRRRIAFVFQETFLFSDTIGWNIRFGASENTPQSEVERVAGIAHVHGDIVDFPKAYDTVLGERGVNLSGGQKQRVAIARALVRDAEVLVLDDSLSAVDTHTEEAILQDLKQIMDGKTTFLISHRISTVALADQIIVIEDGRITQRGRHEELVGAPGLYGELFRKQLSESALDAEYAEEEAAP